LESTELDPKSAKNCSIYAIRRYEIAQRVYFSILRKMSPYKFEFQCDLVQCCFLIHNFVHLIQLYEDEFYDLEVVNDPNVLENEDEEADEDEDNANYQALKMWRNNIADAMWAQYLSSTAVEELGKKCMK
jgi:hypothetical protein